MKTLIPKLIPVMIAAFLFSVNLMAQKTTVSVKVEKDGKVLKDTIHTFEDEEQAEHAMKMMDIMCEDDGHMMKVHKSMSEHHGGHSKMMVVVSEDGKTTEIKEMDGDHVRVMKYKVDGGEDVHMEHEAHGKHVVIMKSDDGETYDILIDEELKELDEDENVEVIVIKKKEEKKKSKKQ
jgi:hypothetical protein